MAKFRGFVGPSNVSRSRNVDPEDTINLILEAPDAGTPKVIPYAYRRPRLKVWARLPSAPVRGLFYEDGRMFAVSGNRFVECFASQNWTQRGTVAVDQNPATISSNGQSDGGQLFVTAGGLGYIYDLTLNTLTAIIDDAFPLPALMGGFLNSKFLVLKTSSNQFNWSANLDGEDWNGLDVARVSQSSDNVLSMQIIHGQIWLFGSQNTSVWWNVASGNTTFAPIDSARIQQGIAASFAVTPCDNTLYWLSQNIDGSRMVMRADGYNAVRVSTHAIETYLSALSRVSDAIAWTYQDEGHTFFLLYLPVADYTLVYDVASQMWAKWAIWDPTLAKFFPYLGRCHVYAFGKHLVGDRQSGAIYEQVIEPGNDSFITAVGL